MQYSIRTSRATTELPICPTRGITMSDFEVVPEALEAYADNLDQSLQGCFDSISEYVTNSACDKSGFTGLLMILHPAVDLVDYLFQETLDFGRERMRSLAEGMREAANEYRNDDKAAQDIFTKILTELDTKVDVIK